MSYSIIWQFTVPPGNQKAFETGYGPKGRWAELFGRAEGFVETILLKDEDQPAVYLTIDRWESRQAFEAFKNSYAAPYAELDASFEGLASAEIRLGAYDGVEA
ncbi:antibiotic biosynthesis monooxygenase family protein [Sphingopyxis fribergensis]